ncbi:ribonuclease R [Planctomycetota bacterium]
MSEIHKKNIVRLLKHTDYRPMKLGQLGKALGVSSEDYPQFKAAFDLLRADGHVVIGGRNLISLPALSGRIVGTFRANRKGFGFVTPLEPNTHGDLFIPPTATQAAMNGDVVAAKVATKGFRAGQVRISGEIIEILQRAQNRFVGTLLKKAKSWVVQPDGTGFTEPICVDDVTAKNAKAKNKVVVEMLSYPTEEKFARGVIIEVLGRAGKYESEIASIIHQYHLPDEFDEQCAKQTGAAAGRFAPDKIAGREDITDKVIITIDPADSKDFDDAISLERDGDGNRVLGVHIADVSYFIAVDSALDVEAKSRGNSIYLPGRTIPMLPEVLSNGVCSLQPGQKRFAKSAYITYNEKGEILSRRFANSLICSTKRLTYVQADKILKGSRKNVTSEVVGLLKDMEKLSRSIEQRRRKNGMLHLDLPETELIMDKAGRVVDACPADDSYPHTMIEMFMVEANDAVAGALDRSKGAFMRRIHPEPDPLSTKNLSKLIKAFGYSLPRHPDRKSLQSLLAAVKGADNSLAVNLVVLRSFEKAVYAPLNIGHYALASTHYCHFTSPIRRYADLLVHRELQKKLQNKKTGSPELDLVEIGSHISFTEQRAADAERELKTVLILQMLSNRVGDQLDCVVTGLTGFGVFVQCQKFGIEGLIRTENLGRDKWEFNQKSQSMLGVNSGCSIRLGQKMKVCIDSVNIPGRQLNLSPAEPLIKKTNRKTKPKTTKRTKNHRTRSPRRRK